jgi:hypothetical protein
VPSPPIWSTFGYTFAGHYRVLSGNRALLTRAAPVSGTALQRGTGNTRWRDFADINLLPAPRVERAWRVAYQAINGRLSPNMVDQLAPISRGVRMDDQCQAARAAGAASRVITALQSRPGPARRPPHPGRAVRRRRVNRSLSLIPVGGMHARDCGDVRPISDCSTTWRLAITPGSRQQ